MEARRAMTFWYDEDENVLEGNRLGAFTGVDGEQVIIDVGAMMADGRGVDKLQEMQRAIETAIEANGGEEQ